MKKTLTTKDLRVVFLGITPVLEDETGRLSPQEIVAFSARLTFKGKSVQALAAEAKAKNIDITKSIINTFKRSSLKGHASMATTPVFSFAFESSKFLDSAISGIVFASALLTSGRRTDTASEELVYPMAILKDARAKLIYQNTSEKNIEFVKGLLSGGVIKDEASKMLQYGVYGTGIFQLSVESLVSLKKEYEAEKKWMPEEIGFLLKAIEAEFKKWGVDLLYLSRLVAPRNPYPYPNIFKDPARINLAKELVKKNLNDFFEILSHDFLPTKGLKKALSSLDKKIKEAAQGGPKVLKKQWLDLLQERQRVCRDYNPVANVKILSRVPWRVWSEKKRHRTVPMVVDSIYFAVERAQKVFTRLGGKIEKKKLTKADISVVEQVFSIPPTIGKNQELLYQWLRQAKNSVRAYADLVKLDIAEKDAIFIIPRGLKIDMVQDYNFFNLIAGYYPLRCCSTAEEELRRLTVKEINAIGKLMNTEGIGWLAKEIAPKCHAVGFCLEEKPCGLVKKISPKYGNDFHQVMADDLEQKFQDQIKRLNKNSWTKKSKR